ncbi:ribosome biogenesis GTPase YqeH [Aerococcus agrisoli]|uniref:Ribosome biogenesis GTPase YqeH n=1 Tax=Aerococcus agrisoli TaxID=2487350 RepID=A0A3N4H6L4_9LACT|nr:ribosome biogenesis GTPase YqeH [Aerococcus agrisoli]RPA60844.1 ribosome biogenesis GTPase YqeH [Aerococcus agrisoli]
MSNEENLYCVGCGALVQTEFPDQRGYTPKSAYEKGVESGLLYCQRCFKLRHYNTLEKVSTSADEFLAILNTLGDKDALIVNVIDIFDVAGSLINGLNRFVGKNQILMVANKMDAIPKAVKHNRIENWLRKYLKDNGIHVDELMLASAKKRENIDALLAKIDEMRQGRDVYVIGMANVGKSSIINRILQATGVQADVITTSQFPGTTLDLIEIPFDDADGNTANLIDTPGIMNDGQMTSLLKGKELVEVLPSKEIRPMTFQLNPEQTLFFGGLARLDFITGERTSFTVYMSNQVKIHRRKLEGSDEFYQEHLGGILQPPYAENVDEFPPLVRKEIAIKEPSDIVFPGLGWVTVNTPVRLAAYVPKGIDIFTREKLI